MGLHGYEWINMIYRAKRFYLVFNLFKDMFEAHFSSTKSSFNSQLK